MILTQLLMLALDDQHDRLMLLGVRMDGGYGAQAFDLMRRPVFLLAVRRAVRRAPAQRTFGRCLAVAVCALHRKTDLKGWDTIRIFLSSHILSFMDDNYDYL